MTSADAVIDFSKLTPVELMFGDDFEQTQQLTALLEEAELYLASQAWCESVKKAYFGLGVSDFIGIFLFEVASYDGARDGFYWVVAGDTPPAHLAIEDCPGPAFALRAYIEKMSQLRSGDAVLERELMRRIELLDSEVLSHYREELM